MNTSSTTVYSTSSTGEVNFSNLDEELSLDLDLVEPDYSHYDRHLYDESDPYEEWCFVCSRATDHRGEHDDLVEQGLASYGRGNNAIVHSNR